MYTYRYKKDYLNPTVKLNKPHIMMRVDAAGRRRVLASALSNAPNEYYSGSALSHITHTHARCCVRHAARLHCNNHTAQRGFHYTRELTDAGSTKLLLYCFFGEAEKRDVAILLTAKFWIMTWAIRVNSCTVHRADYIFREMNDWEFIEAFLWMYIYTL